MMAGGVAAFLETSFTPRFEGDLIEVQTATFDAETGVLLSTGVGYWTAGPDGVAAAVFSPGLGAVLMREVPDDPGGVALETMLAGNVRFTVAVVADGETLTLTARRTEGYAGQTGDITAGVMRRSLSPGARP